MSNRNNGGNNTNTNADRLAKEEADRLAKEEADRLAKEEADRLAKEEADHLEQEEAARLAKEEAARLAQDGQFKLDGITYQVRFGKSNIPGVGLRTRLEICTDELSQRILVEKFLGTMVNPVNE